MRQIKKYIVIALMMLSMLSCSEDLLHTKPDFAIEDEEVFQSLETAEAALIGVYDMFSSYSGEGLWGPIMADVAGEDVMINSTENYGWFVPVYQHSVMPSYSYNADPWWAGYSLLYDANRIIAYAEDIPNATTDEVNNLIGQAKALRGYTLLKLVQMFGQAYSHNPDAEGVMIVTGLLDANSSDLPRASVKEVYQQIEVDLLSSIELLGGDSDSTSLDNNVDRGFMNIRAAKAVLARVYLDMNEWEKARDMAIEAHTDMELMTIDEMLSGFYYRNSETIFTIAYTSNDNNVYFSIPSFYWPEYGYSSIRANDKFVELFDNTDIRKDFFTIYEPIDEDRNLVLKFAHNGQVGNAERIVIRAAEMILIEAECEAELGNEQEARDALYKIQVRSMPGAAKSTASGIELIDEILLERRKELFGEGFRWNDIKRRSLNLKREGDHWVKLDIAMGDEEYNKLTFPIPQSEIDANELINSENQNPGY